MNILMYCLSARSGGAVSYIRNIVPLLSKIFEESPEGYRLKIVAHESQKELFPSIPDSQCLWINGPRLTGYRRVLWEYRNIPRIAHEERIDVLFMPCQIGPRVRHVKQVYMFRNMEPFFFRNYRYSPRTWLRNYLLHLQTRRALRAADRVIAVSMFVKDHLVQHMGITSDHIHLIYHGRNTDFSPKGDMNKDQKILEGIGLRDGYLLTCGSILPYRRYEDVIVAFNHCADTLAANTKLVIAGSGNDRQYERIVRAAIENLPHRGRILAIGHVPRETMMVLYRHCLACVISTEIEACPNIAIEAMSSGCPIISSDRQPLPEIFQGCSLEYKARNIDSMVMQICKCVENETLRRKLKRKSLERASKFSWEKCAKETYSALIDWPKE